MSVPRKMPQPAEFKVMVESEPHVTTAQWAARYGVSGTAVRTTATAAGIKIRRAPHWRKGHVGIRLSADHVAVADDIVSTAAHRLTDFRMTSRALMMSPSSMQRSPGWMTSRPLSEAVTPLSSIGQTRSCRHEDDQAY